MALERVLAQILKPTRDMLFPVIAKFSGNAQSRSKDLILHM